MKSCRNAKPIGQLFGQKDLGPTEYDEVETTTQPSDKKMDDKMDEDANPF
jgi:hypothetical protein